MWLLARRRSRRAGRDPGNVVFGTIGWLFADLMLALAMAFLVATTVGQPLPRPVGASPTPTPAPVRTPPPTPIPEPVLELAPVSLRLGVDWQGLLAGRAGAEAALARAVRADGRLAGRRAGLVLTFGGANGGGDAQAIAIAKRVSVVLRRLGARGYVFRGTVYRPFLSLKSPPRTLVIDVYLFKR